MTNCPSMVSRLRCLPRIGSNPLLALRTSLGVFAWGYLGVEERVNDALDAFHINLDDGVLRTRNAALRFLEPARGPYRQSSRETLENLYQRQLGAVQAIAGWGRHNELVHFVFCFVDKRTLRGL
jgi:hypothetical protein